MAAEPAAALHGPDPRAGRARRLLRWSWLVLWLSCLVPCTAGLAAAALREGEAAPLGFVHYLGWRRRGPGCGNASPIHKEGCACGRR